jgi:16S rRNA processing protein RimM
MTVGAVTSSPGRLVALGEIVGTHGVRGLLRLRPYSDPSAALAAAQTVFVTSRPPAAHTRAIAIGSARPHGRIVLVDLAGIDDLATAEPLIGSTLSVAEADLPAPGPGEFYAFQLEGLEVVTSAGARLGTVASLLATGSNEVLVVRDGAHEHLIPVIADVVRAIDVAGGRVVIEPIDGLLD